MKLSLFRKQKGLVYVDENRDCILYFGFVSSFFFEFYLRFPLKFFDSNCKSLLTYFL